MGRLPALIIMLVNIFRVSFTKPDLNEGGNHDRDTYISSQVSAEIQITLTILPDATKVEISLEFLLKIWGSLLVRRRVQVDHHHPKVDEILTRAYHLKRKRLIIPILR